MPDGSDLAERLATWLEGLDLVPHLGEAGLPTVERAPDGGALWIDPKTGDPLDDEQLAELDRLLHQQGSEPEHAVPVPLLLIARQARLREELLATPTHTYETLARVRGTEVNATRFRVHKWAGAHRLLVVAPEGRTLVPAFQLTDDGEPRPDLLPVLEPLLAARMDPWRAWAWLTQPAALLAGQVPQVAAADPAEADVVRRAAARLAERVQRG